MERKGKDQHNSIIISGYFILVCNTNFMCACKMKREVENMGMRTETVYYVCWFNVLWKSMPHICTSNDLKQWMRIQHQRHSIDGVHTIVVGLARFSLSSNDTGNILCIDCMSLIRLSRRNKRFKCPKFNWNRRKIHTHSAMRWIWTNKNV